MRLIDGDALFRSMEEAEWYNNADRDEIAEELVLNAPTIEERKTGKWIAQKGGGYVCTECGRYALDEIDGNYIHVAVKSAFCPYCGASMMEGEQP